MYTYTGTNTQLSPSSIDTFAPIFGESCAIQTLTSYNDKDDGSISDEDGDTCHDVTVPTTQEVVTSVVKFMHEFTVPCTDYSDDDVPPQDDEEEQERTVKLQFCSTYRTSTNDISCDINGPYPCEVNHCYCDTIDLGVSIVDVEDAVPTCTPTTEEEKTGTTTGAPTTRGVNVPTEDTVTLSPITSSPTPVTVPSTTASPTVVPPPTGCGDDMKWYYDEEQGACTNDDSNVPSSGSPAYETDEECCSDFVWSTDCEVVDVCAPTVSPSLNPTSGSPTETFDETPSFEEEPTVVPTTSVSFILSVVRVVLSSYIYVYISR